MRQQDRQIAAFWAYNLTKNSDWVAMDCESTGLGRDAQIVQVAIVASNGDILFESLVRPTVPITEEAQAIHGISDRDVATAPTIDQVFFPLLRAIGSNSLVIYNAENELKFIRQSFRALGIYLAFPTSDRRQCRIFTNGGSIHCAMERYAQWVGEWNEAKGNYKWQKLPNATHKAADDCKAVLDLIKLMADSYKPSEGGEDEACF